MSREATPPYHTYDVGDLQTVCEELEKKKDEKHIESHRVELLRKLAEMVIYGERNGIDGFFEMFVERHVLALLVNELGSSSARIETQILQTIAILVQNVREPGSLYLLLSSNHVNTLVERGEAGLSRDDETQSQFVALLKTLALRLNNDTVHFFVDDDASKFPLHDCAARCISRKDPMARTAALTTLLQIYRLDDAHARRFVTAKKDVFLAGFGAVVSDEFRSLVIEAKAQRSSLGSRCAQLQDLFEYAQDIFDLQNLAKSFTSALSDYIVDDLFERDLRRPLVDATDPDRAAVGAYVAACLCRVFPATKNMSLATRLFHAVSSSVPFETLWADDNTDERVLVASLVLFNTARKAAPSLALAKAGLPFVTVPPRRPGCQAKQIFNDLIVNDDVTHHSFDEPGDDSFDDDDLKRQLFTSNPWFTVSSNDDDDRKDAEEAPHHEKPKKKKPQQVMIERTAVRRGARLGLLGLLNRSELSLGTMEFAAATLATLAAGVDDDTYAPPRLRPALARAARTVAHGLTKNEEEQGTPVICGIEPAAEDPDVRLDLDDVCADVCQWTWTSFTQRRRRLLGCPGSEDDDIDEAGDFYSGISPTGALLLRGNDFATKKPTLKLLALCDAYAPTLANRLRVDDDDPTTSGKGVMKLTGRRCLSCATLQTRSSSSSSSSSPPSASSFSGTLSTKIFGCAVDVVPQKTTTTTTTTITTTTTTPPKVDKPEWIDLYLVLDDARLILAVPDPHSLASGRVLSSAPLASLHATMDDAATKLTITIASPCPVGLAEDLDSPLPSTTGSLLRRYRLALTFESDRTCRVAHQFLTTRRDAERAKRLNRLLAVLADLAAPHRDLFPSDDLDDGPTSSVADPVNLSSTIVVDPLRD